MDTRIADRRDQVRRERRRFRLRRTVVGFFLLVLVVAAILVERSPLVALTAVEVVGTVRLDPDAVVAAAGLPLGTSTLRLRLGPAQERVEALPLVRSATVRRADPLTVRIEVHERRPVLVVHDGAARALLDATGIVIAGWEEPGLPVVVLSSGLPEVGEHVRRSPALGTAHAVHLGLPGPLRSEVARYEARGSDDLDLLLATGVRVRFGGAHRIDEKARALGALLEAVGHTNALVIDVRAPSAPAVQRMPDDRTVPDA